MTTFGSASNELFVQFIARLAIEIPSAYIGMFSKLKHINASNFELFRTKWKAKFLGGFVVPSKVFEGLNGNFPIGFLVWDTGKKNNISNVKTKVFDTAVQEIGVKTFYCLPSGTYLNKWIIRPRSNDQACVPLKNAVSVYLKPATLNKWSNNAVGYMWCQNNDLQHASQQTALFSSVWGDGHGLYVNETNISNAAIVFSVRRLIKPTWLNDRDQFLQPTQPLTEEFKTDCLIWMLFNGSNLSASADGLEWNGGKWSIINHFIPFTEIEVGATGRFTSTFMVDYLRDKVLSAEARSVKDAGRDLWRAYHSAQMPWKIRYEFKLNRPDVGWYQIRKSLEAISESQVTDFSTFKDAYEKLTTKLRPMVDSFGFLKA